MKHIYVKLITLFKVNYHMRFPFGSLLRNRAIVRRIVPREGLQSTKAVNFQLKKKKKGNFKETL